MSAKGYTVGSSHIRQAGESELDDLIAIDDKASELYSEAGLEFSFGADHPFVLAESTRWAEAIEQERAYVAVDSHDKAMGFIALGFVDGQPYLDQISVLPSCMRRGVGTALLHYAISWAGERPLWLTTYSHLPWNAPYYGKHGFLTVPESEWGSELSAIISEQRAVLPQPEQRVAMVRRASADGAS